MDEAAKIQRRADNFVRAEKIVKRLTSKFFLSNIAARSKNRRSFSLKQLKQWLRDDFFINPNLIEDLLATKAITEIGYKVYAVTKDFRDFFPLLNSGKSIIEIIGYENI